MTFKQFQEKFKNELKDRKHEECQINTLKNPCNKNKFKFAGVYVLVDEDDEVVYIGSAYCRNIRERLLQYQQGPNTGNSSLRKDFIDAKKADDNNVLDYIQSLKAYAYEDESLEYRLIAGTDSVVNLVKSDNLQ